MPVLTPNQETALAALDWLLDQSQAYRGQGRSTIIAIALIRNALTNPGLRVPVRDHTYHQEANRNLAHTVAGLLALDPSLRDFHRGDLLFSRQPTLLFNESRPGAATWLPPDWSHVDDPPPRRHGPVRPGLEQLRRIVHAGLPIPIDDLDALLDPVGTPAWVDTPAFRGRLIPEPRPLRKAPPAPERPQSLWERLEDD